MKRICSIYRSTKRNEMYLYVLKADALERVPEPLMAAFGKAIHAVLDYELQHGVEATMAWLMRWRSSGMGTNTPSSF